MPQEAAGLLGARFIDTRPIDICKHRQSCRRRQRVLSSSCRREEYSVCCGGCKGASPSRFTGGTRCSWILQGGVGLSATCKWARGLSVLDSLALPINLNLLATPIWLPKGLVVGCQHDNAMVRDITAGMMHSCHPVGLQPQKLGC